MLNKNGERELAYVVTVDAVDPISGYDRIEVATVGGWHCVVGKGMQPGDKAIYFEIDSLLPASDERFKFCEKYKYRIKTQRMCKGAVLSQGLVMPMSEFPELADLPVGEGVTERLGVKYYEPEDNARKSSRAPHDKYKVMAQRHGKLFAKQPFRWLMKREWGKKLLFLFYGRKNDKRGWPEWVKKTDEERIQNCPYALGWKVKWTATEKVDGTSTTFTIRRGKHRWNKPEFFVCSRNVCFRTGNENVYYDTNVYTEMAQKYWMRDVLTNLLERYPNEEWITIQGETYGLGIQKNDYGLKEHRLAVFNLILSSTGRVSTELMKQIMDEYSIPTVPILAERVELPNDVDAVIAMADGKSELYDGMREGIVFRSEDGKQSFKAVSNEYLLKCH